MLKKKINKILIGSNNKGKIKEIRDLIPKKYKIFTPIQLELKSPVENGKSFKENSLIKAKNFSQKTNMVCIADDSGLEIDKNTITHQLNFYSINNEKFIKIF